MGVWCAAAGASRRGFVAHHRGPVRALLVSSPAPYGASCVVTVSAMAVTAMVCRGVVSRLWWVAPVVLHLVARLCRTGCGRGCDVMMGPLVWGC